MVNISYRMNKRALSHIILVLTIASVLLFLQGNAAADIEKSVIFVIDASGSMKNPNAQGTTNKIDDAKGAAVSGISGLNNSTEVALIVFYDCDEIFVEHSFSTDFISIIASVEAIYADRNTPLSDSIALAVDYMRENAAGKEGAIILLTDGGESCSGSPVAAADRVSEIRIDCRLHVIDYGSESGAQLRQMAEAGGGHYLAPKDRDELNDNMDKVSNPRYWPDLDAEFGVPDDGIDSDDVARFLADVLWVIAMILLVITLAVVLVFLLNGVYLAGAFALNRKELPETGGRWWLLVIMGWLGGRWGAWRKRRREARERRASERELTAFDRQMARDLREAERERLAMEKARIRAERRRSAGAGSDICPISPFLDSMRHDREDRELAERRIAEERRRADKERLAEERRKKAEEDERRLEEERRRAEGERKVAENRKRKELLSRISKLAGNEMGILPPEDLEMQILIDPFVAEEDVKEYERSINEAREERQVEIDEKKKAERARRSEQRRKDGWDSCPKCGGDIRFVSSYDRWFCDDCRQYLPKSFKGKRPERSD